MSEWTHYPTLSLSALELTMVSYLEENDQKANILFVSPELRRRGVVLAGYLGEWSLVVQRDFSPTQWSISHDQSPNRPD